MEFKTLKKAALFVDYENANATDSYNPLILKLFNLGYNPCIRKLITSKFPEMDDFEKVIKDNEFEFVLSYKTLKKGNSAVIKKKNLNNADFRVYVEVLKTLYTINNIETFVLYTSDDDYTDLICTLKKEGKEVIGVGNKMTTSPSYMSLFHNFIFVEDLFPAKEEKKKSKVKKEKQINNKEDKETKNKQVKIKEEKVINKKDKEIESKEKENEIKLLEKDEVFYSILKEFANNYLFEKVKTGQKGALLIANIVSKLKEDYPYLKDFKKISPDDFKKCGFEVKYQDGKKVKSYIDLDQISLELQKQL